MTTTNLAPPAWAEDDDPPRWQRLADGSMGITWQRIISPRVWLGRHDDLHPDGGTVAGQSTVHVEQDLDGMTADAARELAAELAAAAELVTRRP